MLREERPLMKVMEEDDENDSEKGNVLIRDPKYISLVRIVDNDESSSGSDPFASNSDE